MAKYDDLDVKRIFNVGIVSVVVTAVTALAVQVVYYYLLDSVNREKTAQSRYTRQNEFLAAQTDAISKYGVDPDTANVTIPIEQAMEMIAKESADKSNDSSDEKKDET